MVVNCATEEIPNIIDDKEIEVFITASTERLKRQKVNVAKMKYSN